MKDLKVLVTGTVPSAIKFIANEFKKSDFQIEKVMTSKEIIGKIDEYDPDIVVFDVQMEGVSTYQVIEKVKAQKKDTVFMAMYSFFIDKDMAKESILHRLFASQTSHKNQDPKRPIQYLGIFNENTFDHKISLYVASLKTKIEIGG